MDSLFPACVAFMVWFASDLSCFVPPQSSSFVPRALFLPLWGSHSFFQGLHQCSNQRPLSLNSTAYHSLPSWANSPFLQPNRDKKSQPISLFTWLGKWSERELEEKKPSMVLTGEQPLLTEAEKGLQGKQRRLMWIKMTINWNKSHHNKWQQRQRESVLICQQFLLCHTHSYYFRFLLIQ